MISSAIFFIAVASTSTKYQALVLILWGATLLYFGIFQALILYWLPQVPIFSNLFGSTWKAI